MPRHREGEVTGSGGYIKNVARLPASQEIDGMAAPPAVDAERHRSVHEIVCRGDIVEHIPDLQALGTGIALAVVGRDLLNVGH